MAQGVIGLTEDFSSIPAGKVNGHEARFQAKMIRCGKKGCGVCAKGRGHGPYWYLTYRNEGGSVVTKYVGRASKKG